MGKMVVMVANFKKKKNKKKVEMVVVLRRKEMDVVVDVVVGVGDREKWSKLEVFSCR